MRLVAIEGGGDWADASVNYLVVPDGLEMEAAHRAFRLWLEGTYWPSLKKNGGPGGMKYTSFPEWLVEHAGARVADAEIEVFQDG